MFDFIYVIHQKINTVFMPYSISYNTHFQSLFLFQIIRYYYYNHPEVLVFEITNQKIIKKQ